ncbi:MAG: sigma-70 family RNA polymerase sigma factor [Candidatus Aminicenantes bacterium]|nr:sigma-70 family RNA polymerase sigma factor [Candidatus Aminicenantes bacterium]
MNNTIGIITAENRNLVQNIKIVFKKNQTMKKQFISKSLATKKLTYLEYITPVKKKLYNFINKCMSFSEDTDDIFQEALLKGFKYFDSYNKSKNFNTWLFTIANNLIKDHFRKKKSIIPLDQKTMFDSGNPAIFDKVRDIYHAVGELKSHYRQVFFLFYYNEFKISEISVITGLSESNIKFILTQSRKKIKKYLEVPE